MKRLAAAGFSLLLLCGPALADEAASPERLALAKQVMELNGSAAIYANYEKNLDAMLAQVHKMMPTADEAMMGDIKKMAVEEFNAVRPGLMDETIKIYARHFSEADLKALLAFYQSDAGKHFAAEMPNLTAEVVKLTEPFNKRFMARLQDYLIKKIAAQAAEAQKDGAAPEPKSPEAKSGQPNSSEKPERQGK
jgi:Uncharacterized protein conserved in bacteria